ncbi:hypothetical protein ABU140_004724 [Escherichia coli]
MTISRVCWDKRVVSVQKDGRRIEYTAASLDELNRAINDAESVSAPLA